MIKWQGKCKLALAFVAAAAMLGTAWAAGVSYDSGDRIELGSIESGSVLSPSANGSNTITFTGTEGGEADAELSSKDFFVYGASGDVTGDSSLTVDWQAKLGTKNKVQFFAGGDGGNVSGNSSLTVNAADGSSLYANNGKWPEFAPNNQQSIILAGSPNGGVVKGNTKLTISGALSGKSNFLKASGAAMIDKVGSLTVEGDSTAEIYASCVDDGGFGANGGLHIVANGLGSDGEARGILKGKATLIVDNPNARVEQIWGGNNSVANSGHTSAETGSVEVYLRQGKVGAVTAGPSNWGSNANAVVSKDVYVEVTSADFGADAKFFSPYLGGGGVSWGGGSAVVKGSTFVVVKGGRGIDTLVGGGLGRCTNDKKIGGQADIEGDTRITVKGNSGLKALTEDAWIIAGGKRNNYGGGSAAVGGNATVTFSDIKDGVFKGTITGQGVNSTITGGGIYNKKIDADTIDYTDSVSGDSVLVFDNVQADFSGATIVQMDRIELTSGTKLKLADLGGATAIKITGNWTNFGTPSVLTFDRAVEVPVNFREATGIVSAEFNDSKTELVVTCKNAPIAVTPTALKLQPGKSDTVKATTYAADETVSWKSSDETVATVDGDGKVTAHKAGIAVISATGSVTKTTAGCTVTVEDPAAPDPVPTPAPVTPTVVTEKDNPVTKDKDVPADVKPATPVIKPATKENTTALVKSADVTEDFFTATADGNITVDPVIAKKTVASVMSDDAAVAPKTIVTLPIITATISDGKVAALAMKTTGAQLGAAANNIVSDITLIKILKDETGAKFGYTAEPAGYADQSFTLKNADGNNLAFTDKIDPAATYTLILFVKDNGEFDYDNTTGSVIDPVAMAMNEAKAPKPSGGSSSGCSAGVGVLALLALLPLAAARRKK